MAVLDRWTIALAMEWLQSRASDLSRPTDAYSRVQSGTLANGTGNNQANEFWCDDRTIAAAGNDDLDLAGGVVSQFSGVALTFTALKYVWVANISTVALTTTITVAPTVTNNFLATPWAMILEVGGMMCWFSPRAGEGIVAATGDIMRITNNDGTNAARYAIAIAGTV